VRICHGSRPGGGRTGQGESGRGFVAAVAAAAAHCAADLQLPLVRAGALIPSTRTRQASEFLWDEIKVVNSRSQA
jgi:hypothetical protein